MQLLKKMIDRGMDVIYCNFTEDFGNNINVEMIPLPGKAFTEAKDDELKLYSKQLAGEFGYTLVFHKIERLNIAGIPCILLDYSYDQPRPVHSLYCIFALKECCISFTLTTLKDSYLEYRMKFESVLKTLKIPKNLAKMDSENRINVRK